MEKTHASGSMSYYHQMLTGAFVHPEKSTVIPVCPEPIQRQNPSERENDSERSAFARFINGFRRDHPHLSVIVNTDALHSTAPNIRLLKEKELSFILSVKTGSHNWLFKVMELIESRGDLKSVVIEEELGEKIKKHRIHEFRYVNGVYLNQSDTTFKVNFLDYRETTQWVDAKKRLKSKVMRFSWVTDQMIDDANVMSLMRIGRARWKIENETFNTLKNHGYEFEHNFGHGYENLSTNFAHLMMLAFLVDQLQEIGSRDFQAALAYAFGKRSRLWEYLKSLYLWHILVGSYNEFLDYVAHPRKMKLVADTS